MSSDADDQLGGTGGERGRAPGEPAPGGQQKPTQTKKPKAEDAKDAEKDVEDRDSETSFPASDPPGNY